MIFGVIRWHYWNTNTNFLSQRFPSQSFIRSTAFLSISLPNGNISFPRYVTNPKLDIFLDLCANDIHMIYLERLSPVAKNIQFLPSLFSGFDKWDFIAGSKGTANKKYLLYRFVIQTFTSHFLTQRKCYLHLLVSNATKLLISTEIIPEIRWMKQI